jgi:hypothetical protein
MKNSHNFLPYTFEILNQNLKMEMKNKIKNSQTTYIVQLEFVLKTVKLLITTYTS